MNFRKFQCYIAQEHRSSANENVKCFLIQKAFVPGKLMSITMILYGWQPTQILIIVCTGKYLLRKTVRANSKQAKEAKGKLLLRDAKKGFGEGDKLG